jgi:hypothetical protein
MRKGQKSQRHEKEKAMKYELVYKHFSHNAVLQLYGAYASDELKKAVYAAGWQDNPFAAPPLPEDMLDEEMQTDMFVQPQGSDLFGGSTKEEGRRNVAALRKALAGIGIELGRARKLSLAEQL